MENEEKSTENEAEELESTSLGRKPVDASEFDKSAQCPRQDISESVERRDQIIIGICLTLALIALFFQSVVFSVPDASDHAVFLGIILVGYVAGFLRGKRSTFWGLVFLAINLYFWAVSALRVYKTLHP